MTYVKIVFTQSVDDADRQTIVDIQIHRTNAQCRVIFDLFLGFLRFGDGGMEPPVPAFLDCLRAIAGPAVGQEIALSKTKAHPTPGLPVPQLEHDLPIYPLFPHPLVKNGGLIPPVGWHRWAMGKLLALLLKPGFLLTPTLEVAVERAGRAEGSVDGGPTEVGWSLIDHLVEGQGWIGILISSVSEGFKHGEGLLVRQVQQVLMSLNNFKVEVSNLVEEDLSDLKPFRNPRRIFKQLADCLLGGRHRTSIFGGG